MEIENYLEFSPEETDEIVANAVNFLLQGDEIEIIELLLACSDISIFRGSNYRYLILKGPRAVYDKIEVNDSTYIDQALNRAFSAVTPGHWESTNPGYIVRSELEKIKSSNNWRKEVKAQLQEPKPINQASGANDPIIWNGLKFRSPAEKVIAIALDANGVVFFPNCMGRLYINASGEPLQRGNKEPDFLICKNGKWGILEVDGQTYHQSFAKDQDRDRLFRVQGIKMIEHFDAMRCLKDPNQVVKEFLALLDKS